MVTVAQAMASTQQCLNFLRPQGGGSDDDDDDDDDYYYYGDNDDT